jgi:cysteinyl-tRNA synthetase
VELLLEIRAKVRDQKLWDLSDLIRDRLAELGVQVEDAKGGSSWTWK